MIRNIERKKWIAIYVFLVLDLLQIAIVSFLYLDDANPFVVGIDFSQTNPIVSFSLFGGIIALQILMLYISVSRMLSSPELIELYPKFNETIPWSRSYSRDDIVQWTQNVAKQSKVKVDKIYLMASPLPNAYTFSLPLIGSVVVVHSNTLDILNEKEIQAIIAHELGHIRNRDSIVTIFTRMPTFFIDIVYLYIYVRLILAIANSVLIYSDYTTALIRIGVLVGFFLLSRILTILVKLFMQKASREAELMSDYHAASTLGYEATINGLIRLGQRVEAISVLIDEIRWLESLNPERAGPISNAELMRMITQYPLDGIDEENAREIAPLVFLSTKLNHLRNIYGVNLSEEQVHEIVEPAIDPLLKKRNDAKPVSRTTNEMRVVDWRSVDFNSDRRLSSEEITALVKLIREQPKKMLFNMEVGVNVMTLDHPDFRRRVLFIADEFGL